MIEISKTLSGTEPAKPLPELLAHSKTKDIYLTKNPEIVHIVNRDDITADDGARHNVISG